VLKDVNCRFCSIVSGEYTFPIVDAPLADSEFFVATASIGSFIEGWTLIIPKEHCLSMSSYYAKTELFDFVNNFIPTIMKTYGSLIAFEHGSNCECSLTSCGTSHAHLHLVPFAGTLYPELQKSNLEWVRCRASEIEEIRNNNEYLFYAELNNNTKWQDPLGYVHLLKEPKSQFFRRLLANYYGNPDIFDYKLFPFIDTAKKTYLKLSN
jgi:diadenosine tetraphosphate (Ap4A) HIT family hydrolase